jgi:hypothetical protein
VPLFACAVGHFTLFDKCLSARSIIILLGEPGSMDIGKTASIYERNLRNLRNLRSLPCKELLYNSHIRTGGTLPRKG